MAIVQPLHAICLHLALRESHRRRQVDRLLDLVAHDVPDDAALVIAGDFNDWRERAHRRLILSAAWKKSMRPLRAARRARFRRAHPGSGSTGFT